ncbi:MAG TPA: hypothetical protein PKC43_05670 [Phycisphaerales bacterium]|nr:hypothetical protein [Phycisphaerales bacterium]HMP36920.1 hypothetical protein [Phycisphaerales bacterium]
MTPSTPPSSAIVVLRTALLAIVVIGFQPRFACAEVPYAPIWSSTVAQAATSPEEGQPSADRPASGLAPVDPATEPGKWRFTLAPYLWVGASSGDVGVANRTAKVNVSQREALEALFDNFNGGLSLHFEAGYERWSLFFDGMYYKLKSETTGAAGGALTTRFEQGIFELGAAYRALDGALDKSGTTTFAIEPLAGVRIYSFDAEIDVAAINATAGRDTVWADAFAGVRGNVSLLSGAVTCFGRFDIGTGGSDLAWNAIAGAQIRLATWCSLLGGYRWLSIDRETGSGLDRFEYDVLTEGPFIAVQFTF